MIRIRKIHNRFLLPFLFLFALGFSVMGWIAFDTIETAVINNAVQGMKDEQGEKTNAIVAFHERAKAFLLLAMENPVFKDYFELAETRSGNRFDPDHHLRLSEQQWTAKERMEQWILSLQKRFPIVETCIIDKSGQEHSRITHGQIAKEEDFSSEEGGAPFFAPTMALDHGQVYVNSPYMSADANEWVFSYTSPILTSDGEKPGLFHFEIPLELFEKVLHKGSVNSQEKGHEAHSFILNNAGYILADNRLDISFSRKKSDSDSKDPRLADYLSHATTISLAPDFQQIVERMKKGESGVGTFEENGERYFVVYQPLSTEFSWSIGTIKTYSTLLTGEVSLLGIRATIGLTALIIMALAALMAWGIGATVSRPLQRMTQLLQEMSAGDLTRRVAVPDHGCEISLIALGFNSLANTLVSNLRAIQLHAGGVTAFIKGILKIRKIFEENAKRLLDKATELHNANEAMAHETRRIQTDISQVAENSREICDSSQQLSTELQDIAGHAQETDRHVATVAVSAQQMNRNVEQVRSRLETAEQSAAAVLQSVENLTSSFQIVRDQCRHTATTATAAHKQATGDQEIIAGLANAAEQISESVKMIRGVTERTKLLALNAAIEAANAGAVGRGFAVVAHEVKLLAEQTGDATRLIQDRINDICQRTEDVVQSGRTMSTIIQQIFHASQEIARSVEEENTAASHIALAMAELTVGNQDVLNNMSELSMAATNVAEAARLAADETTGVAQVAARSASFATRTAQQSKSALEFAQSVRVSADKTALASVRMRDTMADSMESIKSMEGIVSQFQSMTNEARRISEGLFSSQIGLDIGLERLDIQQMREEHLCLLGYVESVVHGATMNPEHWRDANSCLLGQWLALPESKEYRTNQGYHELISCHQKWHDQGNKILGAMRRHEKQTAVGFLGNFHTLQGDLFQAMERFYLKIESIEQSEVFMRWLPNRYGVGEPFFDRAFEQFIGVINDIYSILNKDADHLDIAQRTQRLLSLTNEHCLTEELFMRDSGFPDWQNHLRHHQLFSWKFQEIIGRSKQDEFSYFWDLLHFLRNWLVNHIEEHDHSFANWVQSRRLSIPQYSHAQLARWRTERPEFNPLLHSC